MGKSRCVEAASCGAWLHTKTLRLRIGEAAFAFAENLGRGALSLRFEIFLSYSAYRAHPVVGDIFKGSSGLNAVVGIANFGIVDPVANSASVFFHNKGYLSGGFIAFRR